MKYFLPVFFLMVVSCKKGGTDCCLPPADTTPTISVDAIGLAEGNNGTTAFNFTIQLSNASSKT